MIFKHYRELVRPAEAKEWFVIAPGAKRKVGSAKREAKAPDNIVPMPQSAAA